MHLEPSIEAVLPDSFLADVRPELRRQLLQRSRIREVPAGRTFIDQGQPHRCGLILSGLARVFTVKLDGAESTLRRVGPGAAIGVRAIVGRRNRVTVQAISDVELLDLDASLLVSTARDHASVAWAIAQELDRRLDDTELQAQSASTGTVLQKLASALLDLSVDRDGLEVTMSQERLAEVIGASREWVGQQLRSLDRHGLIALSRTRIVLVDPIGLQSIASDPSSDRLQPIAAD